MTRPPLKHRRGGQAGYAALFAILLITAIFTISLVNANLSSWQSQSNLIERNNANAEAAKKSFCQQVITDNSLSEIDFCRTVDN